MKRQLFPEYKPNLDNTFSWWAAHLMNLCQIGGIRLGGHWYQSPWAMPHYDTMVNQVLTKDPEEMLLFCQCKLRVEVFICAIFNRYDAIEALAKGES